MSTQFTRSFAGEGYQYDGSNAIQDTWAFTPPDFAIFKNLPSKLCAASEASDGFSSHRNVAR